MTSYREDLIKSFSPLLRGSNSRVVIMLPPDNFKRIVEEIAPVDRITLDELAAEGWDNLVLDYPIGQLVAVLQWPK